MANIMSMLKLKNRPSRNGFDLSKKRAFTAKCGELLPVYMRLTTPDDKFEIKQEWFSRTLPVNTAAYTRIREYYDFFFVPIDQLWRYFGQFITNMPDSPIAAESISASNKITDTHPYFTMGSVFTHLAKMKNYDNVFGLSRGKLSGKLLWYLGYGKVFYDCLNDDEFQLTASMPVDLPLNPFPLLAYQKIYNDFYRDQNWEKAQPFTFNVDYLNSNQSTQLEIPISSIPPLDSSNMFDIRYSNWNKDMFMGLLPNAQYGDVATIDMSNLDGSTLTDYVFKNGYLDLSNMNPANVSEINPSVSLAKSDYGSNGGLFAPGTGGNPSMPREFPFMISKEDLQGLASSFNSTLNAIALRQVEAMQKYKEILMSSSQDYTNVIESLYNVNIDKNLSNQVYFLKGFADNIDISEVINQAFPSENEQADIAGKGVGVGRDSLYFDADKFGNRPGVLMCIYHATPLLDYATGGISPDCRKVDLWDYANPIFDRIGMQSVDLLTLTSDYSILNKLAEFADGKGGKVDPSSLLLGYGPRYLDYKTDYDDVVGAFCTTLGAWTAPISRNYLLDFLSSYGTQNPAITNGQLFNFNFFKVNPKILDSIFMYGVGGSENEAGSTVDTDQFLINCSWDIKAVRPFDVNGLPY